MSRSTLLLFDVDGTLLHAGGAGRRALESACCMLLGPATWLDFSLSGMTDRAIVRAALERRGQPVVESSIDRVLELYVELLAGELAQTPDYRVLPGVHKLLLKLQAQPEAVAIGLGTGNVRRSAELKLAHGGLHAYFQFGGFGCDHELRAEVLRIGAERGARLLGQPLAKCRIVVIGDTPRDISAGLAIGAECVGVGTGQFPLDALLQRGAKAVFSDLAQPGVGERLVGPPRR